MRPVITSLTAGRAGLIVTVRVGDDRLAFQGTYRTDAFCGSFIHAFLKCFAQVLSGMMRREKLDEIAFMDQDAFELYDRVNQTSVPVEIVSVNRLFERQAQLHPDKTAVIAAGETLTFDQLNRLANRASRGLRALGVGKDNIVGMVLDRTKEIFIAEHAILKAGGAFLPMVPEYPDKGSATAWRMQRAPASLRRKPSKRLARRFFQRMAPAKS